MRGPGYRKYATPIGILLLTAIVGARIARGLQAELGDAALWLGFSILVSGILIAIWLWRRRSA